jgi:hypothetical protein
VTSKDNPSELYRNAIPLQRATPSKRHHRELRHPTMNHKFKVGQSLYFSPSIFEAATRRGMFCVVCLLPADGGENQYRLKSETDGHERVVREGQLALI